MPGEMLHEPLNRRDFLRLASAGAALPLVAGAWRGSGRRMDVLTKAIPSSGLRIPVVGMGTWITFNVGEDPRARADRTEVLRTFFANGGGMIDSSPMYGSSEEVVGYGLRRLGPTPGLFSATKVWTSSTSKGPAQVGQSSRLWGIDRFDLLQVHNLIAWREHLDFLFEMKAAGRLGHVGVTTSHGRRHRELESIMANEPIDFVQLTYNAVDREAERRLLPLARERRIAVIANRPFRGGPLVDRLKREPLPDWAGEIDCRNWPQILLKFIVSHPALTCAIPATSRTDHMRENMGAAQGRLPDASMRARIIEHTTTL